MKRFVFTLIIALFLCNNGFAQTNVIEAELQEVLNEKGNEMVSVNIILKAQIETEQLNLIASKHSDKKSLRESVINELKTYSAKKQQDIMSILQAEKGANRVSDINAHWITNSINCTASADVIYRLAEHPDIKVILYNKMEKIIGDDKGKKVTPSRGMTENITQVNANDVWAEGYTGEGVIVAVIDTGVNYNHVDLADHLWDGGSEFPNHGWDFINYDNDPMDDDSHGTHCAGTICGDGTSGLQTGMAPNATLMCLKALGPDGGTFEAMQSSVEFALEHGADVLSCSFGWTYPNAYISQLNREVFTNVLHAGVVAAVAAGNDRDLIGDYPIPRNVGSPGNCPPPWLHPDQQANAGGLSSVVSVGAVDYNDDPAYFSSEGPVTWQETSYGDYLYNANNNYFGLIRPDVSAPGVDIISCAYDDNDGFYIMSGTSMATPCTAGVMALLLEKEPTLTPADICRLLETTAVPLSATKSNRTGSGRIDALAAIEEIDPVLEPIIAVDSYSPETIHTTNNENLSVVMKNIGDAAASSALTVNLTTNDPYINIIDGEASIDALDINETANAIFTIKADPMTPHNHSIDFNVISIGERALTDLSYGFENGFEDWTMIDANSDGHTWYHNSEAGNHGTATANSHTGTGHLMSESFCNTMGAITPDDYLVSPIKIGASSNTTLSFWACAQDENYQSEHFGVAVSTAGNASASDFTTIAEWTIGAKGSKTDGEKSKIRGGSKAQTTWTQYEVDLSAYAGQDIWLALRHFNCSDQFILLVDDVEIENCLAPLSWNDSFNVTVSNPIEAPSNLTADLLENNSVVLEWEASSSVVDGYKIYRNGDYYASVVSPATTYTDKDTEGNTEFCYTVSAARGLTDSEMSNEVCVTTDDEYFVKPPTAVAVNEIDDTSVEVSWDWNEMVSLVEDFETGDFNANAWNNAVTPDYPWSITSNNPYEGTYSMMSGCAGVDNGSSSIEITVDVPVDCKMSFYHRISSENNWDWGYFYIDDVEKSKVSGEQDWAYVEYNISEGVHTYRWNYTKDYSMSSGEDTYYVDNVVFFDVSESFEEWLYYDNGTYASSVGLGSPSPMYWGVVFPDIESGLTLTKVQVYDPAGPANVTANIYLGGTDAPGTLMSSESFTFNGINDFVEVELSAPVTLDGTQPLWITIYCDELNHPAAGCDYVGNPNSDWLSLDGFTWGHTLDYGLPYPFSWMIRGLIESSNGEMAMLSNNNIEFVGGVSEGTVKALAASEPKYVGTPDGAKGIPMFNHYNVYRSACNSNTPTLLASDITGTSFIDNTWATAEGGYEYKWGVSVVNYNDDNEPVETEIIWSDCLEKIDYSMPNIVLNSFTPDVINANVETELTLNMKNIGDAATTSNSIVTLSAGNQFITIEEEESVLGVMDPNDTEDVVFTITASPITPDEYVATLHLLTMSEERVLQNVVEFGFEDGLEGWTTINANGDDHTWYHNSEAGNHGISSTNSHGGTGHLMSESFCNASLMSMAPDDYLVSPFKIGALNNTTLSFWACAQDAFYAAEHFGVAVSTAGNASASDFTTIAEWTIGSKSGQTGQKPKERGNSKAQTNWTQYTVDLSQYAGQDIWLALRHFNCYDQFILLIDDVEIKNCLAHHVWRDSFSITVSNPLEAPSNLTADLLENNSVVLEWEPSSIPNFEVYTIYRNGSYYANVANTETTFTDKNTNGNTEYCYVVRTARTYDHSEPSNEVCVITGDEHLVNPPAAVAVNEIDDTSVEISWDRSEWLYYDNGTFESAVGTGQPSPMYWAITFPDTQSYADMVLTKLQVYDPANSGVVGTANVTANIYLGGTDAPGTLVSTEPFTFNGVNDFVEVELSAPVTLDGTQPLWITIYCDELNHPAAGCDYVGNPNSDWLSLDGFTWGHTLDYGLPYPFSWMIRGLIESSNGEMAMLSNNNIEFVGGVSEGTVKALAASEPKYVGTPDGAKGNPMFNHYNVYRSACNGNTPILLASDITETSFVDDTWVDATEGEEYKWGVSVVNYNDDNDLVETEIIWSDCLEKVVHYTTMTVNVETDDDADVTGAVVSFVNMTEPEMGYDYEVTLDETGTFTWEEFRKGTYELTISLAGYISDHINEEVVVNEATVITSMLQKILPPSSLVATAVNEYSIYLSWSPAMGAESYNVYRGTELIGNVTTNTFVDDDLTPYTNYCYTVTSIAGNVETEHSAQACATTPDLPVVVPTGLTAEALSHTTIGLSWTAAANAMSYNIYRDGELLANVTTTTYTDNNLEALTEYCYAITSVRNGNESAESAEVCAMTMDVPPVLFTTMTVNVETDDDSDVTGAVVSFVNMTEPEMGYDYEVTLDETGTFTWEEFRKGTYELTISLAGYISDYINEEVVVNEAAVISSMLQKILPPSSLVATAVNEYSIYLSWSPAMGAESYNVYRGTELIGNVTTNTFVDDDLTPYTEYCYTLTSVAGNVETEHSAQACATTPDLPVVVPTGLTAEALSHTTIGLSWTAAANAMSYNIYRDGELLANVTTTTYTDNNLEALTEYCYAITSVRNGNESAESAEVCAMTMDVPPVLFTTMTVNVETDDDSDVTGAVVSFVNMTEPEMGYDYEITLGETGTFTWDEFRKGTYELTINLAGYISDYINEEVVVNEATVISSMLQKILPPSNLVATALSEYSISLSWNAAAGAESYNVYRGTELIGNVTTNTFVDDELTPYTEYCYTVTSVAGNVETEHSAQACATTPDLPVVVPTGLTAEALSHTSIGLSWEAAANAMSYNIYRDGELLTNVSATTYTDNNLEALTEYCYAITSVRNGNESTESAEVCVTTLEEPVVLFTTMTVNVETDDDSDVTGAVVSFVNMTEPEMGYDYEVTLDETGTFTWNEFRKGTYELTISLAGYISDYINEEIVVDEATVISSVLQKILPPSNLVATALSEYSISLSWNAAAGAESYNVYRGTELIGNVTTTTFVDDDLTPYTNYCYTVTSVAGNVETEHSAQACATTPDLPVVAPTGLTAEALSHTSIGLSWTAAANAMSYNIYRDGELLTNVSATTYTDNNLEAETEYCYSVTSVRNGNESAESAEVCVTTLEEPLSIPANLTATAVSDSKIYLNWDDNEDAESYNIYRDNEFLLNVSVSVYMDYGLFANREYCYTVTTVKGDRESDHSEEACATTTDYPCIPPTNLVAETIDEYSISLTWDEAAYAMSYNIYRDGEFIANTDDLDFIDEDLEPDTHYCYYVTSVRGDVESEHSNRACVTTDEIILPCNPPTNLQAEVQQDLPDYEFMFKVTLSWDGDDNANRYTVYVDGESVGNTTGTTFEYGTDEEGSIEFTVTSHCSQGESDHSEPLNVLIQNDGIGEYDNLFVLYPNPADDKIFIDTDENIREICILTLTGVMVYKETEYVNKEINVSEYSAGVYFIKLFTDKGEIIKRFIKK